MISLSLPYPVSANRYWTSFAIGKRLMQAPSHEAKAYKREVGWRALAAGIRQPAASWVTLDMILHPVEPKDAADRVRREGPAWHLRCRCLDVDNAVKVTVDALQGVAYVNDAQVFSLAIRRGLPAPGGGLTVLIGTPDIAAVEQSPQMALPVEDYDPMAMPA